LGERDRGEINNIQSRKILEIRSGNHTKDTSVKDLFFKVRFGDLSSRAVVSDRRTKGSLSSKELRQELGEGEKKERETWLQSQAGEGKGAKWKKIYHEKRKGEKRKVLPLGNYAGAHGGGDAGGGISR